jgi:acetoin utilization protein AcuB
MILKDVRVKDLMTSDPVSIDPDAPLGTAIAVMREKGIRHLPAVDDAGRLIGIITDRDLRNATIAPALAEHLSVGGQRRLRGLSEALEDLRVKDVMTWGVVTTHPEATIAQAAAVMFEGRFGSLPVVEGGKLVGILTERDLLKAVMKASPEVRGEAGTFPW